MFSGGWGLAIGSQLSAIRRTTPMPRRRADNRPVEADYPERFMSLAAHGTAEACLGNAGERFLRSDGISQTVRPE